MNEAQASNQTKPNKGAKWAPKEAVAAFVSRFNIRGAREYQIILNKLKEQGEYLDLPVDARRVYGLSWKKLLFVNDKFAPYLVALNILTNLRISTRTAYEALSFEDKRKNKLPATMRFYSDFPGWAKLRTQQRPALDTLKEYCLYKKIYTQTQYGLIANSVEGMALNFPKNPSYVYGREWRGWHYLLSQIENRITIADRVALMKVRSDKRKAKLAVNSNAA